MDGLTWMRDMINGIEYESMSKKGAMRWCWLSFKIFQHFFWNNDEVHLPWPLKCSCNSYETICIYDSSTLWKWNATNGREISVAPIKTT